MAGSAASDAGLRPRILWVLAVSLDGRLAPAGGGAAQLGGAGDRRALEEALVWADGCLIGAETLRLHGSTCLIRQADLQERRQREGRSAQPWALAVSRSGQFDPLLPFFSQPLRRGLLAPAGAGSSPPAGFDRLWALPPGDPGVAGLPVDLSQAPQGSRGWAALLAQLAAEGLARLLLLGGARLAASLLALDLVDGLQLTLVPRLLGGAHSWLPATPLPAPGSWELQESRPLGQGELLLRYCRPGQLPPWKLSPDNSALVTSPQSIPPWNSLPWQAP